MKRNILLVTSLLTFSSQLFAGWQGFGIRGVYKSTQSDGDLEFQSRLDQGLNVPEDPNSSQPYQYLGVNKRIGGHDAWNFGTCHESPKAAFMQITKKYCHNTTLPRPVCRDAAWFVLPCQNDFEKIKPSEIETYRNELTTLTKWLKKPGREGPITNPARYEKNVLLGFNFFLKVYHNYQRSKANKSQLKVRQDAGNKLRSVISPMIDELADKDKVEKQLAELKSWFENFSSSSTGIIAWNKLQSLKASDKEELQKFGNTIRSKMNTDAFNWDKYSENLRFLSELQIKIQNKDKMLLDVIAKLEESKSSLELKLNSFDKTGSYLDSVAGTSFLNNQLSPYLDFLKNTKLRIVTTGNYRKQYMTCVC